MNYFVTDFVNLWTMTDSDPYRIHVCHRPDHCHSCYTSLTPPLTLDPITTPSLTSPLILSLTHTWPSRRKDRNQ